MEKYQRLINHLLQTEGEYVEMGINEVENLIGEQIGDLFFVVSDDATFQEDLISNGLMLVGVNPSSRIMKFKKMDLCDRTHIYASRAYAGKENHVLKDVSSLPNIFSISEEYLVNKTRELWAELGHPLTEAEGLAKVQSYYVPNVTVYTFENILQELASTLQTQQRNPKVIKFSRRKNDLREIFFNYNRNQLKVADPDALFDECCDRFNEDDYTIEKSKDTWIKYIKGMISGAVILSRFNTPNEFLDAIRNFKTTHGVTFDDYQLKKTNFAAAIRRGRDNNKWKIYGMGKELACNFLKEIGFDNYVKPDVHIQDVFSILGLCNRNEFECLEVGRLLANECGVSAYKFDRVIWLCCSGHYYRDYDDNLGGGADRLKQPFIDYLLSRKRFMN